MYQVPTIDLSSYASVSDFFQSLIEKETQAVGVKMTRWEFFFTSKLLKHYQNQSLNKYIPDNTRIKLQLNRFYSSILDVVRQNKYNILKILVKLQVGLKQKDLNMALLHAVKAGMHFI